MTEKIRPSADWYRRKIFSMADQEVLIGPPVDLLTHDDVGPPTALAFGSLLRLERRNRHLTVAQFARNLNVDEDEIRSIEHDPRYKARPRTIQSIANELGLPIKEVMKLAGAAAANDRHFTQEAMRFAAHSDDIGGLSKEERQLLKAFVEFLRNNA